MSELGKQLWKKIETAEGYAFISDAIEMVSDEQALRMAELALPHAQNVVKILSKFIRDNKSTPRRTRKAKG